MSLTTRTGKGSKLTIEEMDNNLLYLENISSSGGSGVPLWEEVNTTIETRVITNGRLYNHYSMKDIRGIVPNGWHLPNIHELQSLLSYGGLNILETGNTHWSTINEYGNPIVNNSTDEYGMNILPGGIFFGPGYGFGRMGIIGIFMCDISDQYNRPVNTKLYNQVISLDYTGSYTIDDDHSGLSIRLIKDNNINEGDIIIDGDTYNSVTVGEQVWLKQNLAVTHYNNGDLIGSDFAGTTGAVCAYNNDESNVYGTLLVGDNSHLKPLDNRKVFSNNVIGLPNDIYIGDIAPTDPLVKIWIDTTVPVVLTDVDILKSLRDANPQSTELTNLFNNSTDPHTQWWYEDQVTNTFYGALFGDSPRLIWYIDHGWVTPPTEYPNMDSSRVYLFMYASYGGVQLPILDYTGVNMAFMIKNTLSIHS